MGAVIFDLDGTLLDTIADIGGACNHMLACNGYPPHPIKEYRKMVGNGFAILCQRAIAPAPLPDRMEVLVGEAKAYYASHMMVATKPYMGMLEALEKFVELNFSLAVLSNKPQELSSELISHYFPTIPFKKVVGARPDAPLKPDPATLMGLMAEMGEAPAGCAYVGDSDVDMLTAHNAGVAGIGCAWGFRGKDELKAANADAIANDPADLPEIALDLTSHSK